MERLNAQDLMMLLPEEFGWPQDIGALAILDGGRLLDADGRFRIEVLDEAKFDSLARVGLNKDLNRDGNPEGSSRLFAVLWDEGTGDVWVDTDQDGSFAKRWIASSVAMQNAAQASPMITPAITSDG